VAQYFFSKVQGTCVTYQQSDEMSVFLHTYNRFNTSIWFGGRIQKIASVAASIATAVFNNYIQHDKMAFFDARVYNIPKEDVANYFLWRGNDATKNAISSFARMFYSAKDLYGKRTNEVFARILDKHKEGWEHAKLFRKNAIEHNVGDLDTSNDYSTKASDLRLLHKNLRPMAELKKGSSYAP
jgi:tRNA(His) 5'-end guanylyltransferase